MSGAYVIEIEDQTAGLVIAEKGGFRFYASDRAFWKLEGRFFAQVRQAQRAAAEIWRNRTKDESSAASRVAA